MEMGVSIRMFERFFMMCIISSLFPLCLPLRTNRSEDGKAGPPRPSNSTSKLVSSNSRPPPPFAFTPRDFVLLRTYTTSSKSHAPAVSSRV